MDRFVLLVHVLLEFRFASRRVVAVKKVSCEKSMKSFIYTYVTDYFQFSEKSSQPLTLRKCHTIAEHTENAPDTYLIKCLLFCNIRG